MVTDMMVSSVVVLLPVTGLLRCLFSVMPIQGRSGVHDSRVGHAGMQVGAFRNRNECLLHHANNASSHADNDEPYWAIMTLRKPGFPLCASSLQALASCVSATVDRTQKPIGDTVWPIAAVNIPLLCRWLRGRSVATVCRGPESDGTAWGQHGSVAA
jgi:hypothetical protein